MIVKFVSKESTISVKHQGQNIYAKAVKCKKWCLTLIVDSLETNFTITAYLPLSLNGTLS